MPAIIEGIGKFEASASGNTFAMNLEDAVRVYDQYTVKQTDRIARALGVYSDVRLDRGSLKMRFASWSTPRNLFRARKNGCSWNPVSGPILSVDEYNTCPIEYNGEQCPDAFWNDCWERIFGQGNDINNLLATAEGQALVASMLRQIYTGLGNSFFDLANFAAHPRLTVVNNNGLWQGDAGSWADYYAQQTGVDCGGIVTLLDALRASGMLNLSVNIPLSDVNTTTKQYTGDIMDLVAAVKAASTPEMKAAMVNGVNGRLPVWLATAPVYEAYLNYIRSLAPGNELAYKFMVQVSDGETMMNREALMLDGMYFIQWDAFGPYDAITGDQSYRLALVVPGVFGVLSDLQDVQGATFGGAGLIVQQSPLLKDKGLLWMAMNMRFGAGLADTNLITMASGTYRPVA